MYFDIVSNYPYLHKYADTDNLIQHLHIFPTKLMTRIKTANHVASNDIIISHQSAHIAFVCWYRHQGQRKRDLFTINYFINYSLSRWFYRHYTFAKMRLIPQSNLTQYYLNNPFVLSLKKVSNYSRNLSIRLIISRHTNRATTSNDFVCIFKHIWITKYYFKHHKTKRYIILNLFLLLL